MRVGTRTVAAAPRRTAVEPWQDVDAIAIPRVDEAGGHARPGSVGTSYAEQEFHTLADEQELLFPAEGEQEARPRRMRAQGLVPRAEATAFLLAESQTRVRQSGADYQHAVRTLSPYTRRESGAKARYWICWPVLWFGDTAGVWSAAVTGGDIVFIAFGQACAAGLAAACAGLVGAELKYARMARARRCAMEDLTEDERRYRHLFTGSDGGGPVVKLIGALSLLVVALVAVGVFTLRASIEGSASGLTFGLLAAASALGSLLLGYASADEVADLIAAAGKRAHRAEKRHMKLASSAALRRRAEAMEAARSLHAEYELRGQAAGRRVESMAWRVQRRNPAVFGHGYATGDHSGIIGRRRRGGAA